MTSPQHLAAFEGAAPQSTRPSIVVQPAADPAAVERSAYRLFLQAAEESSRPLRRRLQPGVAPRPARDVALAVPLGYQLWLAQEDVDAMVANHGGWLAVIDWRALIVVIPLVIVGFGTECLDDHFHICFVQEVRHTASEQKVKTRIVLDLTAFADSNMDIEPELMKFAIDLYRSPTADQ